MKPQPPKPLDYASPQADPAAPHGAAVVVGTLLLVVGLVFFFVGIVAIGLGLKAGRMPDGRSIAAAAVGALIAWAGTKLKGSRPERARWAQWRCATCGEAFGVDAANGAYKDRYSGLGDAVHIRCAACGDMIVWVREDGTPTSGGAAA
jgi:hypothetical protein